MHDPLIERPAALLLLLALILSIATAHMLNAWWADDTTCVECVEVG